MKKTIDLPLGKKLTLLAVVYALIGLVLLGLSYTGFMVLDGVRAYVSADGIWTLNQKNAVYNLLKYTQTKDEQYYREFEKSIAPPKSFVRLHLELEKPDLDRAIIAQALTEGGLHPEDAIPMIFLFHQSQQVPFFADTIAIWAQADELLQELENYATHLHREMNATQPSTQRIAQIHQEIDKLNSTLSILEANFVERINHIAHLTDLILAYIAAFVTLFLATVGYIAYRAFSQYLLGGIANLCRGTERVALGDFSQDIPIQSADELGQLARAFNDMVQNLATARLEVEDKTNNLTRALREEENLMASIPDIMYIINKNGKLQKWNQKMEHVTGYTAEELAGKSGGELLTPEGQAIVQEAHNAWLRNGGFETELSLQAKNGQVIPYFWKGVSLKDENGATIGLIGIGRDITSYKRTQERLDNLAHYDLLTGLANRSLLGDRLHQAVARAERHGGLLALVFIDLNKFKEINDSLGHDAGDILLKTYAGWLKASLRGSDTAARWGGDEFVLLIEDVKNPMAVLNVVEKIFKHEARPLKLKGEQILVSSSIGISIYPLDGTDPLALLKNADNAMYRAKEQGGSCYKFASKYYETKTTAS